MQEGKKIFLELDSDSKPDLANTTYSPIHIWRAQNILLLKDVELLSPKAPQMVGSRFFANNLLISLKLLFPTDKNKVWDSFHLQSLLAGEKWVFFNIRFCVACWAPHSKVLKNETCHTTKKKKLSCRFQSNSSIFNAV